MEKKIEATIVYCGYVGIMEKGNGSYNRILGLYRDIGKENGSYNIGLIQGYWKRKWKLQQYIGVIQG